MSARIVLTIKPGSKSPGIEQRHGDWILRVGARAIDGAANEACIRALSELIGVPPSKIALVRGVTSRQKTFTIDGVTLEEALARLSVNAGVESEGR